MKHLGYPEYFGVALVVFKILDVLALIIPQVSNRLKEWAYAGFAFNFLFAMISHLAVDETNTQSFFPLIVLGILAISISNSAIKWLLILIPPDFFHYNIKVY